MTATPAISIQQIWSILETVNDPEVPVLSVLDLGIVREVKMENRLAEIVITPTYTGCPAIDAISMNIRMALLQQGITPVRITQVLSPAWSTDWMTEQGKQKLKAYGIAPPVGRSIQEQDLEEIAVQCPQCNSWNTRLVSQFGSTSCKALFQCNDCKEPFDHFKCH